jgi:CPA1 family monovalent cation:H+ antiporter
MVAVLIIFAAIIALVALANRIKVAYPIVLLLGGIAIGYIPYVPTIPLPPDLVLVIFLPPLLYWEAVTAPTSEFRRSAWWIFQMAFGLVIVTTLAVAWVAHTIIPGMTWGVAFVLGAIVSSTDEIAFSAIADKLNVPRHVIGTIEGESLINDATSLILYAVGIAAVVGASFSLVHALGALALSVLEALAIGLVAGGVAVLAWRAVKDDTLQGVISLMVPFISYLPAYYIGASGVLATVTTGLFVTRYTPTVLQPRARELIGGFWVTIVFLLNAFIFVQVGIRFHAIVGTFHTIAPQQLIWWGVSISMTCIGVRLIWTFLQGLLPSTNEPEHIEGKADWSHVAILGWTGMRGGVSLAAALAIPLETSAGLFPHRDLVIFITFCVLIATLVGQGATLPFLIRYLGVKDDGTDEGEERIALAKTAKAALRRIAELGREGDIPSTILVSLRDRFRARWEEFTGGGNDEAARQTALYRQTECNLLDVQRKELIRLRDESEIDNTVMRRVQRLLDLETSRVQLLGTTGHAEIEDE